jgi:hypothetical protein
MREVKIILTSWTLADAMGELRNGSITMTVCR